MKEHLKDEPLVRKQISDVVYEAMTTSMTEDELADKIWGILEKAEKVMR